MSTTPSALAVRPKTLLTSLAASIVIASLIIKAAAIRRAEGRRVG